MDPRPADDPTVRVAALFDALSASYDAVGVDFFQPIASSLLSAMPARSGERWLDLGCGKGAVLQGVARAVGPDGRAEGIDISPAMVELANRALLADGLIWAAAKVGNAMSPECEAHSFDTIASCLVLFFLPDPAAALRSWRPLLVPGGRLGVTTFGAADEGWEQLDDQLIAYLPADIRDARTTGSTGPFATDAGMEELLRLAGFEEISTVVDTIPVRFDSAQRWYDFSWSTGQRLMWMSIPESQRETVRAQVMGQFEALADADGSVVFSQQIRHTLGRRPA